MSVRLTSQLVLATGHHLRDALREIRVRPGRAVHLNRSGLLFADVAGARVLCLTVREPQAMGRQVTMTGAQPVIRRVAGLLGPELNAPVHAGS